MLEFSTIKYSIIFIFFFLFSLIPRMNSSFLIQFFTFFISVVSFYRFLGGIWFFFFLFWVVPFFFFHCCCCCCCCFLGFNYFGYSFLFFPLIFSYSSFYPSSSINDPLSYFHSKKVLENKKSHFVLVHATGDYYSTYIMYMMSWFYLHSFKRKNSAKNEMKLLSAATMKLVHFGENRFFYHYMIYFI